jgi:tRNA(adenine34) deaminase
MNFMEQAVKFAKQSGKDIPVGAIIVKNGEIIASACNTKEKDNDVTSHAEILAIRQAAKNLGNWRLEDCEMYVTLEPCPMCGWAILQSRIKTLYFGSYDSLYGAFCSKIDLRKIANSKLQVYGGILEKDCDKVLADYFQKLRG